MLPCNVIQVRKLLVLHGDRPYGAAILTISVFERGIDRFLADGSMARLGTPSLANAEIIVASQTENFQVLFNLLS